MRLTATKQAVCRDAWRLFHLAQVLELSPVEMSDLSADDARRLLGWLDAFPPDRHGPVWLEAYEEGFRGEIVRKLSAHRGTVPPLDIRPRAQLVFCIDVRSESFRRHVEAQGPYETFGFAGFFGIPLNHQAFDSEERAALCPVLLTPKHAVTEIPRLGEEQAVQQYATGTCWHQLGHHVFHDLKHHPVGSMMLIDVLGFFFSLGLLGKTLIPKVFHAIQSKFQGWSDAVVPTRVAVAAPPDPGNPQWAETKSRGDSCRACAGVLACGTGHVHRNRIAGDGVDPELQPVGRALRAWEPDRQQSVFRGLGLRGLRREPRRRQRPGVCRHGQRA